MTINEYQTEALRTAAGMNHPNNDEILLNGVMGLCGESGECVDMVKKYRFQGHEQCINIQMFCGHTKPICSLLM